MRVTSSWFEATDKTKTSLGISTSEVKKPKTSVRNLCVFACIPCHRHRTQTRKCIFRVGAESFIRIAMHTLCCDP